ncbi:MAG: hypothetical protein CL843_19415 [Crocinitomicaceae bacterium]|nr:hypothetical protein [Crocinitomicaceae bacterium]|tara:strand:- start:364 stop:1200 length:837 start_codon:yes stop_codon:yes gene_type:complete
MSTKFRTFAFIFTVFIMGTLASCSKDDDDDSDVISKPKITDLEVGISDSHVGYIGSDLHLEAEIVAEGKISEVTVEIHQEEGGDDEIEVTYTDYAGLKNTTFHKHVDIPEGTAEGEYHLHLTVTDEQGNQTTVEEEITIEMLEDEEAPEITISSAPGNGNSFSIGETISISGTITDNVSLAGALVALVYEDDNIEDADVSGSNTSVIVMLHTHDFDEVDSFDLEATIEVGAANDNNMTPAPIENDNAWKSGNYYILVKSKDANGNAATSNRYPIEINL